ncbi:hypothetical protein [Blastococcus haudaquaticus]|uniref:Uncharacterized protein n=1 Tax=Blastococcus haudaquaticus TaxID=1938745 RepID=A0A286GTA0_9ACTN|nr:hypothetical protein [Blastococcus haudaquaticus]SOD98299.1 hypothetical protein SAMN06272739_1830 [Blastococcus haudaquaticus]
MPPVPPDPPETARPPLAVRVPVPGADVGDATAALTGLARTLAARRPESPGDLQLTVRRSGTVRLTRRNQYGRYPIVHPVVTGRLTGGPNGVELVGAARPARFHAWTTATMAVAALPLLFTAIVAGTGIGTDGPGARFVLLAVVAALVGAVRWDARRPRRGFAAEVDDLLRGLTTELATGGR